MSARKSRTSSITSSVFNEIRAKWLLWCEDEGVEDPPNMIKVDSLKRPAVSFGPFVEQSEDDYVKLCSPESRAEEKFRDSNTEFHVHMENVEPFGVKGLRVQGKLIDAPLSGALCRFIEHFQALTTLKLIKCCLLSESMFMLSYILKKSSVTHLYLDENRILDQNYHLVLNDNEKLLYYSLRLNMIKDSGAVALGKSLHYSHPLHQVLRSLNLNGNLIDDDGACALADALRWNRNLTCLSLAGNRIGDRGGIALGRTLMPFNLTEEDLKFRAELICNRLLEMKTLMDDCLLEQKTSSKVNLKDKTSSKLNLKEPVADAPPVYPGANCDLENLLIYYYDLEKWADTQIPPITNPIVSEVIETEDGDYQCKGNDSLWYLNLSYNLLTEKALMTFMDAFRYQETAAVEYDRKLWLLEYEGNQYDPQHPVLEELESYFRPFKSDLSLGSKKGSKSSLK